MTDAKSLPALTPIGENSTPLWGMTNAERLRRLARAEGLPETSPTARLYVNLDYVFDPVWLRHILTLPGTVLMDGGDLVTEHLTGGMTPEIGRATSRERVCQCVLNTVVAVSLKKKKTTQ